MGATVGMRAVVLIELIGLSKFILGFGIQLFFAGIGQLIGPPIIGNKQTSAKKFVPGCEKFLPALA